MSPHQATFLEKCLARLLCFCLKILSLTLRYEDHEVRIKAEKLKDRPLIIAIWHNRLALGLSLYQRLLLRRFPNRQLAALVSASRDGAFLSEVLKCYQVQSVRGSSSRRGAEALKEMVAFGRKGFDLAITPDGPRGPRYELQSGILTLAQISGHPILPVSYYVKSKITTKGWDGFQIPLPFSRCEVVIDEPVMIPRRLTIEERDHFKEKLQSTLRRLSVD